MLFIICLIVAVVSCFLIWLFDYLNWNYASVIAAFIGVPIAFAAIIMTIIVVLNLCTIPSNEAKWQEQYKSLNTRIEQHLYYPWDRTELIEEVQKWNNDLAARQAGHNSIWTRAFYPESLDGLDKIELGRIK